MERPNRDDERSPEEGSPHSVEEGQQPEHAEQPVNQQGVDAQESDVEDHVLYGPEEGPRTAHTPSSSSGTRHERPRHQVKEKARMLEMDFFKKMGVKKKVDRGEVKKIKGKIVSTKWVDTDKGHGGYRSRLVGREIKRDKRQDLFSPRPPLEVLKLLIAYCAKKTSVLTSRRELVSSTSVKPTSTQNAALRLLCLSVSVVGDVDVDMDASVDLAHCT